MGLFCTLNLCLNGDTSPLILLSFFLISLHSVAQDTTNFYTGKIVDAFGEGVAKAKIKVYSEGKLVEKVRSKENGKYKVVFPETESLKYKVVYSHKKAIRKIMTMDLNSEKYSYYGEMFESMDIEMIYCQGCKMKEIHIAKFYTNDEKDELVFDPRFTSEQQQKLAKCLEGCR